MKKRTGQISMEYLMMSAFTAAILLPTFIFFYMQASDATNEIDEVKINNLGRQIISTAEAVFIQGPPSRIIIDQDFPDGIERIDTIQGNTTSILRFIPKESSELSELTFVSDIPLTALFSAEDTFRKGKRTLVVQSIRDGEVALLFDNPYDLRYSFDEIDRNLVEDVSGNGLTGVIEWGGEVWNDANLGGPTDQCSQGENPSRCPTHVQAFRGKGFKFDGDDDIITIPHNVDLEAGKFDGTWTITGWFIDGLTIDSYILEKSVDAMNIDYQLQIRPDKFLRFYTRHLGVDEGTLSDVELTPNTWTHFAMVKRNPTIGPDQILYVNGVRQIDDDTGLAATPNTIGDIVLGEAVCCPAANFGGTLDEFRIYGRELTAAEIVEDMNSAYPIERAVASYSFETADRLDTGDMVTNDTHANVKGNFGGALSFDGFDDQIIIEDNVGYFDNGDLMDMGEGDFTIDAWFKTPVSISQQIVNKEINPGTPTRRGYSFYLRAGAPDRQRLVVGDGTDFTETQNGNLYDDNNWHNIRGVRDDDNIFLYLDNIQIDNADASSVDDISNDVDFRIGNGAAGAFNGVLDEIKITKRVIT